MSRTLINAHMSLDGMVAIHVGSSEHGTRTVWTSVEEAEAFAVKLHNAIEGARSYRKRKEKGEHNAR